MCGWCGKVKASASVGEGERCSGKSREDDVQEKTGTTPPPWIELRPMMTTMSCAVAGKDRWWDPRILKRSIASSAHILKGELRCSGGRPGLSCVLCWLCGLLCRVTEVLDAIETHLQVVVLLLRLLIYSVTKRKAMWNLYTCPRGSCAVQ